MGKIYLGIMSGTSLDGIDVAVARFDVPKVELLSFYSAEFPVALRADLMLLATAEQVRMDALARMHFVLSTQYADAVQAALGAAGIPRTEIRAIGLHGQTVRHLPPVVASRSMPTEEKQSATLQLGSGAALAALTEIDVVHDFRSADIALGGQGAPLMPMFDYQFLRSTSADRLIVNIGGIANVAWLPCNATRDDVKAFDSGPGNMLLDAVTQKYFHRPFDPEGEIARSGKIDTRLLDRLYSHSYFSKRPPKSTGRELFSEEFLSVIYQQIASYALTAEDALSTLTELTARSIAQSLSFLASTEAQAEVIVSGGGAFNTFLLERILANIPRASSVTTSAACGIPPKAKEAIAFAFFAQAFIDRLPIHLPATTGARRSAVLGSLSIGA